MLRQAQDDDRLTETQWLWLYRKSKPTPQMDADLQRRITASIKAEMERAFKDRYS
jgi:hypothetical protein